MIQSTLTLLIGIIAIVVLTTRYKVHAFFALLLACVIMGAGLQLSVPEFLQATKTGFGNIIGSLGLIIILGTVLGLVLEHTGCMLILASVILRKTGNKKSPLAMNLTGYTVGLPIFCDSGFIVLSGLNKTMAYRTGVSITIMASSLAAGLYAVHCLVPPHPGAAAATATLGASFGKVILYGMLVSIPTSLCGYLWATYMGSKLPKILPDAPSQTEVNEQKLPSFFQAILPVIIPIVLIGIHAFIGIGQTEPFLIFTILHTLGIPEVALTIGILLALSCKRKWRSEEFNLLLRTSIEKAAEILIIIGAGGAFGAILAKANITQHFSDSLMISSLGLWFPFLVAAVLKTAQGSSSVAIITASSIVLPLLSTLDLDHEAGKILCVLAMGAGSMVVSHANDSYFWVIAQFSGVGMGPMLRVYTVATLMMGTVAMLSVYLLSFLL